jgi:SAM-dependent methyltransferase
MLTKSLQLRGNQVEEIKMDISFVSKAYLDAFNLYGRDKKAIFWPKGRQELRFRIHTEKLISFERNRKLVLLDYGCGLGDLHNYLLIKNQPINYIGIDLNKEILKSNRFHYPNAIFLERDNYIKNTFLQCDFSICIGTFNIMYKRNYNENIEFIIDEISRLYSRTKYLLSVDFMTDKVDYMQKNAFHISPEEITRRISKKIKYTKLEVVHGYLKYEYTLRVQR